MDKLLNRILDTENKEFHNKKFLGNYILATDCGFAYMLKELNEKLQNLGQNKVDNFFPRGNGMRN